jgi:uncharacterized membrane protein
MAGARAIAPCVLKLYFELCKCWSVLEQPPPFAQHRQSGEWKGIVAQYALAFFWLSLVPFTTGWMGENHFTTIPVALYGFVLLMAGTAYYFLSHTLANLHGKDSTLARAMGKDKKGKVSVYIYMAAVPLCFVNAWIGLLGYAFVATMWLIPDRRIENILVHEEQHSETKETLH